MSFLHESMTEILKPIMGGKRSSFDVKEEGNKMSSSHLLVVLYWGKILKGKDLNWENKV